MQTRHKIPTIFNLSMVDVLCCALGCIILLWLVYFKEARERSIAAGETGKQLAATKLSLDEVLRDLISAQSGLAAGQQKNAVLVGQLLEANAQRELVLGKLDKTDKDLRAASVNLKDARLSIAELQKNVKDLDALNATVKAILAQKTKEHDDLAAQFLAANLNIQDLQKVVGDQKGILALSAAQAAELKTKLAASEKKAAVLEQHVGALQLLSKDFGQQRANLEAKTATLQGDLDKRKTDLADASKRYDDLFALKNALEKSLAVAKGDLAVAKGEIALRDKALTAAQLANLGLAGETKVLNKKFDQLRSAAENRFAGIELTGSRVLFLVDMSGSMRMKDTYVEDPDKWPLVCEILGKIIKSLPNLKQFQVILFSDKVRYPLSNSGKWHDYHGVATVKNAIDAVKAEVPQNATNMSIVFEEAFKYRGQGLDTIYLLSDGLPNEGDGLPPNAAKLPEIEQSGILGKYIRDKLKSTWNAPQGPTKQRVRINTVGFYYESPDVGAFLWSLARDNEGSFVGLSKP